MCGIFGQISPSCINANNLRKLAMYSQRRGKDSSGLIYYEDSAYFVKRADCSIKQLIENIKPVKSQVVLGHSRLITNGLSDNQPVVGDNIWVLHNGIIVNENSVWQRIKAKKTLEIDSELIVAIAKEHLNEGGGIIDIPDRVFSLCKGVIACALGMPDKGKLLLFSNNGSLYAGNINSEAYFASEMHTLAQIGCDNIKQIKNESFLVDIPVSKKPVIVNDYSGQRMNLIPGFKYDKIEEGMLQYRSPGLKRCARCILPETMPFIRFDSSGVCNYCRNYKYRNKPKPKEELFRLVEPYRRENGNDCIVPFSGGRDSCYTLHLMVNELKMKPVAYTYDWGMVTDLARRNISAMCAALGVEHIIIAADISEKRKNIAKNLKAWLKSPDLGMVSMLTAGDKHFFRHIETVKKETGINLNIWGINPLEVTYFKSGFLGIKPDFEEKRVYTHGFLKQIRYQFFRFKAMLKSPGYFNSSLWDTLSGEYYRSFAKKKDYYHIYDFWRWDEKNIEETLSKYDWEYAVDTNCTWRIGDGTAAFYNYIYYTIAGFTEHDTFRSNQIREGDITRERALELVKCENRPRYQNIRWYLDTLGMDFKEVIGIINAIPKLYKEI